MFNVKKFWQLPNEEKFLLVEAAFFLPIFRLCIRLIPFRYLAPYLGETMVSSISPLNKNDREVVKLVSLSIHRAANNLPWKSVCLPRAMTAKIMLRRRNIESTLYLGVSKNESRELCAHAWIKAGDQFVTGGNEVQNQTIINSFV